MWTIVQTLVTGIIFTGLHCYAQQPNEVHVRLLDADNAKCIDEEIWLSDGSIDCSHLLKDSVWGVNTEAEKRCTRDRNTKCCLTCKQLGFSKATSGSKGTESPRKTPAPPIKAPVTKSPPGSNEPPSGTQSSECVDVGIWFTDGTVECTHLITPSIYGLTSGARRRCLEDTNVDCCKTCRQLVSSGGTSGQVPETTPKSTKATPTPAPSGGETAGSNDPNCQDEEIWIADTSLECRYLEEYSVYGVHNKPQHYCLHDSLTSCCKTCAKLGYYRGSNRGQTSAATTTTPTPTVSTTTTTTTRKTTPQAAKGPGGATKCRDFGIWTQFGILSCKYLEKKSYWNIHKRPESFCRNPLTTWCCETCSRMVWSNPNSIEWNIFGIKIPKIPYKNM